MKDNKAKYMSIFKINKLLKMKRVSSKKSYSLEKWQTNNAINGSTCETSKIIAIFFIKH